MKELLPICKTALAAAKGAGEVEVYAVESVNRSVTIEKNDIQLASSATSGGVGVRVFVNKAVGFGATNVLDKEELKRTAKSAVAIAKSSQPDDANVLPDKTPLPKVEGLHHPSIEKLAIGDALEYALRMLDAARKFDKRITIDAGSVDISTSRRAVVNSRGVEAEEISSAIVYYLMGMARDGDDVSTFLLEFGIERTADKVDVEKVGRELAEKLIATLGATKGESFKGPVVLEPDALSSLVCSPIIFSANAENVQKKQSRFAGKLGQKVASGLITISDDGLMPGGVATSAFDREGVAHAKLSLIKNGVLENFMYDTRTALRDKRKSTGHAAGGPRGVPGIGPTNFTTEPGKTSKDEIIAGIERGILVNRFSGWPNPISGDFSGVVKGGFEIKNGKIGKPLTGTLIAGNLYELIGGVSAVSKERKQLFSFNLPWMRVENVSVTSG
jgi:PmbA protein